MSIKKSSTSYSIGSIEPIVEYKPLNYHWLYLKQTSPQQREWTPLSFADSKKLENVYNGKRDQIKSARAKNWSPDLAPKELVVLVNGGRFEVNLIDSKKRCVYWKEEPCEVRRCLWFYKENTQDNFEPYDEDYCQFLEHEYERTLKSGSFNKSMIFARPATAAESPRSIVEEAFVFHSATIMVHYSEANLLDENGNMLNSDASRPRVVKRGLEAVVTDKNQVEPDEIERIDHVCFVVHGIGEGWKGLDKSLSDCVTDMRKIAISMTECHVKPNLESENISGRIELIPVTWHEELHSEGQTGVDNIVSSLTLPSIPKFREISNNTFLDVLYYSSPAYCQRIITRVGNELNRLLRLFMERNPYFNGKINLVGHSLGTLILFDLLMNQKSENADEAARAKKEFEQSLHDILASLNLLEYEFMFEKAKINKNNLLLLNEADLAVVGLPLGPRKELMNEINNRSFRKDRLASKDQILIHYPNLSFRPANLFALGSPVPMFLAVRGIEHLGTEFKLPTCDSFFNVFHPYDPVAYRIEPLLCSNTGLKPVQIPHHQGRKRLHLQFKEDLEKVDEIKTAVFGGAMSALNSALGSLTTAPVVSTSVVKQSASSDTEKRTSLKAEFGRINKGRRVDYALQESPLESINEYLFSVGSHSCYWTSEDTMLLIVREVYGLDCTAEPSVQQVQQETANQSDYSSWLPPSASAVLNDKNLETAKSFLNSNMTKSLGTAFMSGFARYTTNKKN